MRPPAGRPDTGTNQPIEPDPVDDDGFDDLMDEVANDPEQIRLRTRDDINRACVGLYRSLINRFEPSATAELLDDETIDVVVDLEKSLHQWLLTLRNSRPTGLRLVSGRTK